LHIKNARAEWNEKFKEFRSATHQSDANESSAHHRDQSIEWKFFYLHQLDSSVWKIVVASVRAIRRSSHSITLSILMAASTKFNFLTTMENDTRKYENYPNRGARSQFRCGRILALGEFTVLFIVFCGSFGAIICRSTMSAVENINLPSKNMGMPVIFYYTVN
jgi:hypothetical protein